MKLETEKRPFCLVEEWRGDGGGFYVPKWTYLTDHVRPTLFALAHLRVTHMILDITIPHLLSDVESDMIDSLNW